MNRKLRHKIWYIDKEKEDAREYVEELSLPCEEKKLSVTNPFKDSSSEPPAQPTADFLEEEEQGDGTFVSEQVLHVCRFCCAAWHCCFACLWLR